MSIAGGLHNALLAAAGYRMDTVQLFTKNASQWAAKPLGEADVRTFRKTMRQTRLRYPMAHDSYLINLGSPDEALFRRSVEAFIDEMNRAEQLGLRYLIAHPGAALASSEAEALARIARGLDEVHHRCPGFRVQVLLETTAGQGSTLGHRFEHLAAILAQVRDPTRIGICFDTCHVFAAGYPLFPESDYRATMRTFDRIVGLRRIKVFHLNDSVKPLGSRVDRHAHIGRGQIGREAFRLLVNDARFRNRPMILETPKEELAGKDMDGINLALLRRLVRRENRSPIPRLP
jgi:deoxyribonuclease-4